MKVGPTKHSGSHFHFTPHYGKVELALLQIGSAMHSDMRTAAAQYEFATFPSMVDTSQRSAVALEPLAGNMLKQVSRERKLSHPVRLTDDETLWALNAKFLQELEIYGLPTAAVHIAGHVSDEEGGLWYYYIGSQYGTSVIVDSVDSYLCNLLEESETGNPEALETVANLYGTFILKSASIKVAIQYVEFISKAGLNFMDKNRGPL